MTPTEAAALIQQQRAEIERLSAALEPFARVAAINEPLSESWPDDKPAIEAMPGLWPTWGDLKNARAALGKDAEA